MSHLIDLFESEGFIPNDLRPPNLTFKSRKARRINKNVELYKNAHKRTAACSAEKVVTNKSMRLCKDFNPSHRLSMRLDDGKRPARVSSRLNDGLPNNKNHSQVSEIGNSQGSGVKF